MEKPFEIERTFPVSAEKVWRALTDPQQIQQWYFKLPGFKAEVGYKFEFMGGRPDGIQYRHLCEVTEVIPGRKLSHTWRYDGYEGNSVVTWELFPEGNSTRLRLTHSGLETFPGANPDFAAKNFENGWTGIIGKSLQAYLARFA